MNLDNYSVGKSYKYYFCSYLVEHFGSDVLEDLTDRRKNRLHSLLDSLPIDSDKFWQELGVTREEMEAKFEADLYRDVDNLSESIARGDGWVGRLISMNRDKLVTILNNNTGLTDNEKQDLLSRNSDVKSGAILQKFGLTHKERELLMSFVLSGYGEEFSGRIERSIKGSDEFRRAYEFIIREKLFNEHYTAVNAKTSSVHRRTDRDRARGIDGNARQGVTYH